jgi:hypothetical protein
MTEKAAKTRPQEGEVSSRKQSGLRRAIRDESTQPWPNMLDQDSIPTEPANEQPRPPSVPSPVLERFDVAVEVAPPSHEELRDTIPSPPPERD